MQAQQERQRAARGRGPQAQQTAELKAQRGGERGGGSSGQQQRGPRCVYDSREAEVLRSSGGKGASVWGTEMVRG